MRHLVGITLAASVALLLAAAAQRTPWALQQIERTGLFQTAGLGALAGIGGAPPQPFANAKAPNWSSTDAFVGKLQEWLKTHPQDSSAGPTYAQLGGLYLQKARETADPSYYAKAEAVLQRSLELTPENVPALTGTAALQLARHDFAGALSIAQRAVQLSPTSYAGYGLLGDALIELGRYPEAIDAFQEMVDRRPDLTSLSRVSYARELHGDVQGAIDVMHRAADAGAPGTEATAWTRIQLGNLYFAAGNLDEADTQYRFALAVLPDYAHGVAGLARVAAARGDLKTAADLYSKALQAVPRPEYAIALGDIYRAAGNQRAAAQQDDLVRIISRLQRAAGVDVDLEMALFEADHANDAAALTAAVQDARAQYARRPSIHAADVLAWTLYRAGQPADALPHAREALRLGSKDSMLLFHAGTIAAAAGQTAEARTYLETALAQNPHFSVRYAPEAQKLLAQLKGNGR